MKYHEALLSAPVQKKELDLMYIGEVGAANQAALFQNAYKIYKKEVKDPNEANHARREPTTARRSRLNQILQQYK